MNQVIPDAEAVTSLLSMIFGEDTNVQVASRSEFTNEHVATFLNPEDQLVAISACDTKFVAYSGAALSMIPSPAAEDMIQDNDITDAVQANFYEVMNMCSKLMLSDTSPHLRLAEVLDPGQSSTDAVATLSEAAETVCFDVDIPRYGIGQLNFIIA